MSTTFFIGNRNSLELGVRAGNGLVSGLPLEIQELAHGKKFYSGNFNEGTLEFHDKPVRFCFSAFSGLEDAQRELNDETIIVSIELETWVWAQFRQKIDGPDAEMSISNYRHGNERGR